MTHKHQRPLTLDYIALLLAAVLWFAFLLSGTPYTPSAGPVSCCGTRSRARDGRPPRSI